MLYVATSTQASGCGTSLQFAVNLVMRFLSRSVHMRNWLYLPTPPRCEPLLPTPSTRDVRLGRGHREASADHCSTETEELQSTRQERRTVHAAMMPTSVLPAPHGSTMMPERARWLPNMRESDAD